MNTSTQKSTVAEIRQRFEKPHEVDRFSNLDTGQATIIDARLVLDLIASTAAQICPQTKAILDIGCGAGNYSLKLLEHLPDRDVTLVDLSQSMLDRACQRIQPMTRGKLTAIRGDIREISLEPDSFDIITAAAVFHHLRTDEDWRTVFSACFKALRPGGSLWISDLISHDDPIVQRVIWERYGEFLTGLKDAAFRDHVFGYIEQEDTPRSLTFQLDLLRQVGFASIDVLHKNGPFAAFGAVKKG